MARPVISLKTRRPVSAENCPQCQGGWYRYRIVTDNMTCVKCGHTKPTQEIPAEPTERFPFPACWIKGQLLNVRKSGDAYILTLLNEEFDPQNPDRALHFNSPYDCQEFVSWWYARENHDPRAG